MLTVICPIFNEEKYISQCIESIVSQDYPKDNLEVLLVDGMSTDRTREIVTDFSEKYPFFHLLDNPKKIVPCAMNIGIKAAKGDIIMRIDAHSLYPSNYFSDLVKCHTLLPEAWNIGGMCDTKVINSNKISESIAKVMSDKFGVGNSTFRTGATKDYLEVDTVPFGCYKAFVFEKIGLYNEKLVRVQDLELNKRLKHTGGKIYLIPSIHCTYIPRDNYKAFFINRYQTGYWVIKTCFITHSTKNLGVRHFIPALFVLSLVLPLIAGVFWKPCLFLSASAALFYSCFMLMRSIHLNDNKTSIWSIFKAFCCIHFSYGLGSIVALFHQLLGKDK